MQFWRIFHKIILSLQRVASLTFFTIYLCFEALTFQKIHDEIFGQLSLIQQNNLSTLCARFCNPSIYFAPIGLNPFLSQADESVVERVVGAQRC